MAAFSIEDRFRTGEALYGDDFDAEQIAAWFRDEEHAYARLWHQSSREYGYHALNHWHGFRHLPRESLGSVLAFGSAHGQEVEPLLGRIADLTLLDSSDTFGECSLPGIAVRREKALPSGDLPFATGTFDLITCFGVLHHIPNVSRVLTELHRTLRPGGWLLLREPSTSMGNWTLPRPGLTPRERGIPPRWMKTRLEQTGLTILHAAPCHFSPLVALSNRGGPSYARMSTVRIDACFSRLFAWNERYVSEHVWEKFRPGSTFYVARKAPLNSSA